MKIIFKNVDLVGKLKGIIRDIALLQKLEMCLMPVLRQKKEAYRFSFLLYYKMNLIMS